MAAVCLVAGLWFSLLFGTLAPTHCFTQPAELDNLLKFRDALLARGGNWEETLSSWKCPTLANNSDSPCDPCGKQWWGNWDHMACRSTKTYYRDDTIPGDGLVTHIHMSLTGVEGPPFQEICLFPPVKEWDMKVCNLNGTLPDWVPSCLPVIEEYDLSRNKLVGTVPSTYGSFGRMNQFKMQGNMLTGTLPPQMVNLTKLEWLRVFDNTLEGSIPASYAALSPRLTQVSIGGNRTSGNLYNLASVQLQSTNITFLPSMCGMVPVGFAFANGFDLLGSGLGLPCPEEVQNGWPDPQDDF